MVIFYFFAFLFFSGFLFFLLIKIKGAWHLPWRHGGGTQSAWPFARSGGWCMRTAMCFGRCDQAPSLQCFSVNLLDSADAFRSVLVGCMRGSDERFLLHGGQHGVWGKKPCAWVLNCFLPPFRLNEDSIDRGLLRSGFRE